MLSTSSRLGISVRVPVGLFLCALQFCLFLTIRRSFSFSLVSASPLFFFFFNDPAPTEIYTLSLHDALPISPRRYPRGGEQSQDARRGEQSQDARRPAPHLQPDPAARPRPRLARHRRAVDRRDDGPDRKSTRLNSSHDQISYAVFCLKKKTKSQDGNARYVWDTLPPYDSPLSVASHVAQRPPIHPRNRFQSLLRQVYSALE